MVTQKSWSQRGMFLFYCCLVTFSYSLIIPHRLPSRATFRSSPFKGFNGLRDSATSTRQHSASTKNIIDIAQVQQDPTVWTMPGYRKPLHWVQKVSHLEDALQFYKSNFNFEIYRHEEFASGCEATCNGPYGGAWSKTMMGPPGGEGQSFCLELVYNYGVNRYERGNELRSIGMNIKSFVGDKSLIGVDSAGQKFLDTPDGHWLNLIDDSDDRISVLSTASNSPIQIQDEAIKFISVHVSNLTSSIAYYKDILGANVRINTENSPSSYAVCTWDQIALSENKNFDDIIGHVPVSPTAVILTQLSKGAKMEFEASQGRMAIETDDAAIEKIAHTARISEENGSGKIVHGPVCLEPHGEKVLIVRDEDGHEYCFVDARGFKTCVDVSIKQNTVDWDFRKNIHKKATVDYIGGKGFGPFITEVEASTYDKIVAESSKDVLVDLYAPWCILCARNKPVYEEVAKRISEISGDKIIFSVFDGSKVPISVIENDELKGMINWAKTKGFPTLFYFRNGEKSIPIEFNGDWTVAGLSSFVAQMASFPLDLSNMEMTELPEYVFENDTEKEKVPIAKKYNLSLDSDEEDDDCGNCSL